MSTHLTYLHDNADDTLYVVFITHTGQAWNGTAMEAFDGGNWTDYAVAGTVASGYLYGFDLSDLPAGDYQALLYSQLGATPDADDPSVAAMAARWTGAALRTWGFGRRTV